MSILVVAEHDNASLNPSTLNTVSAAAQIGGDIDLLVAGLDAGAVVDAAKTVDGISKVISANHEALGDGLAENIACLVKGLAKDYSHILVSASNFGKNFMPRVAALLDMMQISDITEVLADDTFVRPIYAGNALQTVQSSDAIKLITVRTTAFEQALDSGGSAEISNTNLDEAFGRVQFVSRNVTESERPDLTSAKIVTSGGRGVGSKEDFALIEQLAEKLNAAVGASRAAVDAGYAPNDYQVGQTGKVVAPDLYIAIGISGAIQHLAGMKESKVIVAINKDEEAPIFNVADYGIVADLFDVVPELIEAL
jgi:electron transfer flavoprotein alpha subunit